MCLQAQGIDDDDGRVGRVRRSHRLSDNNGGVGRGQGIYNASEGSDTTAEATETKPWAQGIYDNDGGVGGGIRAKIQQQRQQRRWWRIYDASKGLETTAEAAAD